MGWVLGRGGGGEVREDLRQSSLPVAKNAVVKYWCVYRREEKGKSKKKKQQQQEKNDEEQMKQQGAQSQVCVM